MEIIDISLPIYEGMPVYPGTGETKVQEVKSQTGTSVLSRLEMSSHTGTHVDAPAHTVDAGLKLSQLDLAVFYGPARVVDMTACRQAVMTEDLQAKSIKAGERILLKTSNSNRGFKDWYDDYVYLDPQAAEYLAQTGVALVGIDSLGIKKRGEPDNTSHTALQSRQIPILEGLNLKNATEGQYTLAAFPIALQNDGAPARAVLIKE